MTSQLNVDTIVDKAGSGGTNVKVANTSTYVSDGGNVTQNTVQGLAKAWGNLNGSGTPAFRDSLNMASVTDNGTGSYTPAYTNNMNNTDYSSSFFSHEDNFHTFLGQVGDDIATNNYKLPSVYHNGSNSSYSFAATDTTKYNVQFFGDLA